MSESKRFVLIVDDNKENLKVVSNYLKREGYEIALSLNAEGAYAILEENEIDLILLDVMMPGEDGYTFCRRIKKEERYNEIPVIFLTAMSDTENLVEGFKAGGVDYITKPFRKEELLARVKSHVELSKAKKSILAQANLIQQINMTRDRMYSVISHDIKAPFANISMMISMISEGYLETDSDDFREILANLNYSTKETYSLLENLLNWTRSQTGNLVCVKEKVSLQDLVENSLSFISLNAENKNISINYTIDDNLMLNVDPNMMKSVIRNLLSNAVKFTDKNGQIYLSGQRGSDGQVIFTIRDTGVGMPKDRVESLFSQNLFVSTSGTSNEKGSGLGLHLVRDFSEANNGTVDVISEPDKGTTFIIKFPSA